MTKPEELKRQIKEADTRLSQFIGILSDDYPELGICSTGSMEYNSAEIGVARHVAKATLSDKDYTTWQKLGLDSV